MTHRISDGPVGEACGVTEVSEVVDVAEELTVQLGEADDRDRAVLVESPGVALQPRAEVRNVRRNFLNHHPPGTQSSKNNKVRHFFPLNCALKKKHTQKKFYLISLLQMASGVSNSPRNISEIRSAS